MISEQSVTKKLDQYIFRNKKGAGRMYNILLKMKTKFEYEQWLKMVNQAKTRGKLTDEEYKKLTGTEEK